MRRKPDPCIYDQFYLMQLGVPVTWDNPDIWLTEVNGTPVESSQLLANHEYVVNGRIWDAAFDPALGVEVRCYRQDWGFNGLRIPVELNPNGTERVVVLDIAPWGNAVAEFHWTTPPTPGHFCLKVECFHPDDRNPGNNVGQENTDVRQLAPGEAVVIPASMLNPYQHALRVAINADVYRIPEARWEFPLETYRGGLGVGPERGERLTQRSAVLGLRRWLADVPGGGPELVRYRYLGADRLFEAQRAARSGVPAEWEPTIHGQAVPATVPLDPGEVRSVDLRFRAPTDATRGNQFAFNFQAVAPDQGPLGGFTVLVSVR